MSTELGVLLRCSGHLTRLYFERKISHTNGVMDILDLGPKSPFWALSTVIGAQHVQVGAEGAGYQVKVCGEHESNSDGPIGGSRDQIWTPGSSEDLRGPQKGHFGQKRALLGPPGAQKGPDTRSKCVVSMSPAQADQLGAVGTKSGPPGPSEDLRGPQKGHSGPKRALLGAPGVP